VKTSLTDEGRTLVKKIAIFQSVISLLFTFSVLVLRDAQMALSALLGGAACVLPSLIFGLFAFKFAGASKNRLVVRSFSQGTKIKFMLTLVIFALSMQWQGLSMGSLLLGFIIPTVAQWPYMIFSNRLHK